MKTVVKLISIFFILTLLFSFQYDDKYSDFEGIVEYEISFPNQRRPLSKSVTSKFTIFYKQGNIRKEYKNINDSILFYSVYKIDENINYGITPGNDTITYYQPTETLFDMTHLEDVKDIENIVISEIILGYKCNLYRGRLKYNDASDNELPINYSYYVSEKLKVNPKNLKGEGANFIFMENGSIILKYIADKPILRIVTAKKVIKKKLNDKLFTINQNNKVIQQMQ